MITCCKFVTLIFRLLLLILTAFTLVYGVFQYIENDSTTSTEYRTYYKTAKDVYPSINLCFTGHFLTKIVYETAWHFSI